MFDFIPVSSYTPLFYWLSFFVCLCTSLYYMGQDGCSKLLRQNVGSFGFMWAILLILYMGLRPVSGRYFGDMIMYNFAFYHSASALSTQLFDFRSEWLWEFIMKTSRSLGFTATQWFLLIEFLYIGLQAIACKRLLRENLWMALMFVCFSFQFFTFGTNGIRNGLAASIMTLAISFLIERNIGGLLIGLFLCTLAMGCHRSSMLPIASMLASIYMIKDTKKTIYIWLLCLFMSIIGGSFFQNFFASLGFDDRMSQYSAGATDKFSRSGFRWDFMLYSAMPVWLVKYMSDRGIHDKTFSVIANTYILSNSFWLLVCRAAFSNRFAYLSWFLYAYVLAYAVIRVPIWKDQDKRAGQILLLHSLFTISMYVFYHGF